MDLRRVRERILANRSRTSISKRRLLLAAIPKSPEYSPTRNMEKAKTRRDIVLDQMAKYFPDRYSLAEVERGEIKTDQTGRYRLLSVTAEIDRMGLSGRGDPQISRRKIHDPRRSGRPQGLHNDQRRSPKDRTRAIRERLRAYDRGRAWRSDYKNLLVDEDDEPMTDEKEINKTLETFKHADWYGDDYKEGEYIKGLVMKANSCADEVGVRFGRYKAVVGPGNMGRSGKRPKAELKPGFLAEFLIKRR